MGYASIFICDECKKETRVDHGPVDHHVRFHVELSTYNAPGVKFKETVSWPDGSTGERDLEFCSHECASRKLHSIATAVSDMHFKKEACDG